MASEKNCKNVEIYTVPTPKLLPEKETYEQKKFWSIDKEMLRFKIHYFLLHGAFGTCLPYLTIFAQKRVGISVSTLAAILTSQRIVFIFVKPSIGYTADYFKKLKAIIGIISVITAVFFFALLAVPKIENGKNESILDHDVDNHTSYDNLNISKTNDVCEFYQNNSFPSTKVLYYNCKNFGIDLQSLQHVSDLLNHCFVISTENLINNSEYRIVFEQKLNLLPPFLCKVCDKFTEKCKNIDCAEPKFCKKEMSSEIIPISDFQRYQFWLYAFISTITLGGANSIFCLTDTACCDSVQKTGAQFGRQSVWGAIGWGLLCPIGGLLNDYTGDFLASWILMAIILAFDLLNMTKLKIENPEFSKNLLKDVGTVLSSKEFPAFLFCVVMNGVGTAIMWFYLVLFLTDIGGSRFLCGMVKFVQSFVGGIPFMFFSGWVIKKIGHFNVIILSLLAYSIRFFWYSQLQNPWLVLPVEVLHGITEGLFYTNVASFAKLSAKPGTEATTQAVLFTAHEAIGVGIGCVVAGIGFDSIGGHKTFLYLGIYAVCAMVLSVILYSLFGKKTRSINLTPPGKA